ncbi:hypothetical protein ABZ747_12920 [Kitasatospora cineracea]|uniref:hypothetical protein n=1 Tax=Kitasatospora cineracea TaxID=88074 RepID=UPI0033DCEE5E
MLLLLFLVLVPVFFGTLVALLVRSGRAAFDRRWERLLALLLSGAALLVLGLVLLHLAGAVFTAEEGGTDSSPMRPCRIPGKPAEHVIDYRIDLVPAVGFSCVLTDGSSYGTDEVPAHLTPLAAGLGLLAAGARSADRRRTRTEEANGPTAQAS